ncbi:hypothetical protein GCM10023178_09820 [Actinomadura luteofluorescens]
MSSDTATAAVPVGQPDPLTVAISMVTPFGPCTRRGAADAGALAKALTAIAAAAETAIPLRMRFLLAGTCAKGA